MTAPDSKRGLRVLVIDDDDIAREMLCETLRQTGHDVRDLPSPIGASRTISQEGIEAAVLDVMMPSINGDKLARLLRQAGRGQELTIILVSSRPVTELQALATAAKADAVLSKSQVRRDLATTLERAHLSRMGMRA